MKAVVLETVNEPVEVVDVDVDTPQGDEVVVRTVAAGICHSEVHVITGTLPIPVPTVLGHESAGIVEEVGPDVVDVRPGDLVVVSPSSFCGSCRYCVTGRPFICERKPTSRPAGQAARLSRGAETVHQTGGIGGLAEVMLISERALVSIDPEMPHAAAALLGCGVQTGLGAVFNRAKVEVGSKVAVIGCGGVGLNVVQAAALSNAEMVIAVDVTPEKLEIAKTFGATHVVNSSREDVVTAVRELSKGGVDHAFEAIGRPATVVDAMSMLAFGGTTTVVGYVPASSIVPLTGAHLYGEKRLQYTNAGSNRFRLDIPTYVSLYLQGRLKLDALVSERIALQDVNAALEALKSPGQAVRRVVVFE